MNRNKLKTVAKSIVIIAILLAFVFALRAPAADLNMLSDNMKGEYIDSSGLPYFSEMDSYYNLRLTENFIDHGYVGDQINSSDGASLDMHRYAPDGNEINYELGIVYVTDFVHNIFNMFGSHSVKETAFWTGSIIASLAVIPAYIFARRLTNDYGAITAVLIITLAPNYFAHTFPGFFDTDMFYYIFSLFFIFFFVEAIRTKDIKFKVLFGLISLISIGLFSISWTGYIFYVGLMGIFSIVYLISCYLFEVGEYPIENYRSKLNWFIHQPNVLTVIGIIVVGLIGFLAFKGFDGLTGLWGSISGLLNLQSSAYVAGGFPNVLVSVAEMQMPNLIDAGLNAPFIANSNGVVNGIGGMIVLLVGIFVLYSFIKKGWKFRKAGVKSNVIAKPPKSERKSAASKIDQKYKFNLSFKDFTDFDSVSDLNNSKQLNLLYTVLFVVWAAVTLLAVSKGSRFITTIVLPFGLLAGIFVGQASEYIKNKLKDDRILMAILVICGFLVFVPALTVSTPLAIVSFILIVGLGAFLTYGLKEDISFRNIPIKKYLLIIALVLALVTPTVCGAYNTAEQVVPGTSDAMWNSMVWINQNTPDDTVITSWWDFGYLFEIASDRQATFDGGSQSGDRAFWLGQAMTTDDLNLSAGIFRMLDTTGTKALDALLAVDGFNNDKGTQALIKILPMNKDNATKTLMSQYGLSSEQANNVTQYSHPDNPRPVIFVASSDMLSKAYWWTYFGNWNFTNQSSEGYQYYVPSSEVQVSQGQQGKLNILNDSGISFNVVIDRTGNNTTAHTQATYENGSEIYVNNTKYNPLELSKLIVIENGSVVTNKSVSGADDANYTLLLMGYPDQNSKNLSKLSYTPIIMSNELENSMFTRLFLYGGYGQDVFKQVHTETGISLWQVNFNATAAGS